MKDLLPKFSDTNEADPAFWRAQFASLRLGVYRFLEADGNDMCHENRVELGRMAYLTEIPRVKPLPFFRFMWNCLKYHIGLSRSCKQCKQGDRACPSNRQP